MQHSHTLYFLTRSQLGTLSLPYRLTVKWKFLSSVRVPLSHEHMSWISMSSSDLSRVKRGWRRMADGDEGGKEWMAQTIKIHAVQCAKCGKFRSIPFKKLYEKIRENVVERPWVCVNGLPWNPKANCEAPDEFVGNSRLVMTMDRPGIPVTPAGWDRQVHIRAGPGNEHFSDVFYFAPGNGKLASRRLRSMKGVERYVDKFPKTRPPVADFTGRFSFARPVPPDGFLLKRISRWSSRSKTFACSGHTRIALTSSLPT